MAPYVAAVIPSRFDDGLIVKVYLPIDAMKYLDNASQKWVWDAQFRELIDVNSCSSMHDLLPSLQEAKQCDVNIWDLRSV
jgi:hypothetical protein